jgi:alkanesulfonate monooxygenase SsuD/methylene tetrahydromethanopterin reductase-like flavin-dependent oxidoreductase (luciferase family)
MKLGLHFQMPNQPVVPDRQRFVETIEQAVHAEALGYESVWPVEQHFDADASLLSAPLLLLAAIAARTTVIRLGTAVLLAPLHHPVRLAADLASLDVLSGGRVECGLGRGADPAHFARFGAARAAGAEQLDTCVGALRRHWTEGLVHPWPLQRPHPPIRIAVNSVATARWAGGAGLPILVATHINPPAQLGELLGVYRAERSRAGHADGADDVSVLVPLFAHRDPHRVRALVEPGLHRIASLLRRKLARAAVHVPSGPGGDLERAALRRMAESVTSFGYDHLRQHRGAVFGSPQQVLDVLGELDAELRVDRWICWFDPGGLIAHEAVVTSMEEVAAAACLTPSPSPSPSASAGDYVLR